jgi:hypothetical protein
VSLDYMYNLGMVKAACDLGFLKVANPEVSTQIAMGADPSELQQVVEAKITEKDVESAAKIIQVVAQMKQQADEAGMMTQADAASQQQAQMQAPPQPMMQPQGQGMAPQQQM